MATDEAIFVFTRDAIRQLDDAAINEFGIPGVVLMENASRHVADEIFRIFEDAARARRVLIVCGKGNNGGDGLALARHLHNVDFEVQIACAFDPDSASLPTESQQNLEICRKMGLFLGPLDPGNPTAILEAGAPPDVIVDALLGTGLTQAPRAPLDSVISWINAQREARGQEVTILAVDIPSGLDCDTGRPLGDACVKADVTVSFVGLKQGFLELDAQPYIGEIVIGDIGAPIELCRRYGSVVEAEPLARSEPNERPAPPPVDRRR